MAITVSSINPKNAGSEKRVDCVVAFGTYNNTGNINTTGELLLPAVVGMTGFSRVVVNQESGYQIEVLYSQSGPAVSYPTPIRFRVLQAAGGVGGTTSSNSAGTPAGNINAQSFSGNALAGHSHTFSGNAMGLHTHQQIQQQELKVPVANQTTILNQSPNIQGVYATAGGVTGNLIHVPGLAYLATGTYFYDYATSTFSFFAADAITEVLITYLGINVSSSAGVPAGTIDSVSAGTPSGTVQQAVFAGNALAGHDHTYGGGGGGANEVANGTDLSAALGAVQIICYGV